MEIEERGYDDQTLHIFKEQGNLQVQHSIIVNTLRGEKRNEELGKRKKRWVGNELPGNTCARTLKIDPLRDPFCTWTSSG